MGMNWTSRNTEHGCRTHTWIYQGPSLAWYEDCSNRLEKTTWQVITCQVIWRGVRGQGDKSTCQVNLSSWIACQVEVVTASGICHLRKKVAGVSRQRSLSKKRVFGCTRCEIWPWHNPPSTSFSRYKQSRSNTGSTHKNGINKERESERFSHPRCRMSQEVST